MLAPVVNVRTGACLVPPFAGHVSGVLSAACSAGKRRPLSWLQIRQRGPGLPAIANETKKLAAKGKRALAEKLLAQGAQDEAKEPIGR